jgi:hypothetical protein
MLPSYFRLDNPIAFLAKTLYASLISTYVDYFSVLFKSLLNVYVYRSPSIMQ